MSTALVAVKFDRSHLMTALRDAVEVVNHTLPEEAGVSPHEMEEALEELIRARFVMEKFEGMQSYETWSFFERRELDTDQVNYLTHLLGKNRLVLCHKFLEIDIELMEEMLADKEGMPPIPYPWALRALFHAYHAFQQPPNTSPS